MAPSAGHGIFAIGFGSLPRAALRSNSRPYASRSGPALRPRLALLCSVTFSFCYVCLSTVASTVASQVQGYGRCLHGFSRVPCLISCFSLNGPRMASRVPRALQQAVLALRCATYAFPVGFLFSRPITSCSFFSPFCVSRRLCNMTG